MLRDERDYLLRMIQAAAATAARLRERLAGGGSADEVAAQARQAQGELLGQDAALLSAVDPRTAATMVSAEKLKAWAALLDVEAAALAAQGKADEAAALEQRRAALHGSISE